MMAAPLERFWRPLFAWIASIDLTPPRVFVLMVLWAVIACTLIVAVLP